MRTEEEIREKFNHYEYIRWDDLRNMTDYGKGFADALGWVLTNIKKSEANNESR